MKIESDWHIHSRNSCDEASLAMADLVREAAAQGIRDFGVTDHIHTPCNLPDLAGSRAEYLGLCPSPRFHFGVEASCVSQWELERIAAGRYQRPPVYGLRTGGPAGCAPALGLTESDIETYRIEYVVAGTHWPLYVPFERAAIIRDYHRQNLFLASHPLVDVVAHPWWWQGHWQDSDGNYRGEPWLDDFEAIPRSMHEEFAAAAFESGTAVEINLGGVVLNPRYPPGFAPRYLEYMAALQERGVRLSLGSDCHAAHYAPDFERAARLIEQAGIAADFWGLPPRVGAPERA